MVGLPLKITDSAQSEIREIKNTKGIPVDYHLRIGVKGSGCAGVNYYVGFDTSKEQDKTFDLNGIKIIVAKKDFMHLIGVTLDFIEHHDERGFDFITDHA